MLYYTLKRNLMKSKKLKLNDLEISSFVTALDKDIKVGGAQQLEKEIDTVEESGWHTCKSHLYTECCSLPC